MREIRFRMPWSDGSRKTCYSPSFVIRDFSIPGEGYHSPISSAEPEAAASCASAR